MEIFGSQLAADISAPVNIPYCFSIGVIYGESTSGKTTLLKKLRGILLSQSPAASVSEQESAPSLHTRDFAKHTGSIVSNPNFIAT